MTLKELAHLAQQTLHTRAGYLVLPDLDPSSHKVAKAKAKAIFSRAR